MSRFAVTSNSLSNDIRAAAASARRMGFSGLVVPSRTESVDLTELSDTGAREYRHILSSFDQNLLAIDCSLGKDGFSPTADIDRALSRLSKVINSAAELGRAMVCLDLGPLPPAAMVEQPKPKITPQQAGAIIIPDLKPAASSPDSKGEPRDQQFESTIENALRELGHQADRHGVIIALRSSLAAMASIDFAMKSVNCPWFGIDLDTVHLLADDSPADELFSRLGSQIRHVRARDAVRGAGARIAPCEVGGGSVDWNALMKNLAASDYRGWITIDAIDLPNPAAAAEGAVHTLSRITG